MKKVLITGASGFIGSYLVEDALQRGYEVYAGIRKTSNRQYLSDPAIKFIELDYSDTDALNRQIADAPFFDFIIHNAGLTKAFLKKEYVISNFHYTRNFVDALINQKRVPEKFIYMSSLAAYGPGHPLNLDPVKLSDTPKPVTAYGKSKLESEKYLSALPDFPHIIIRPTAVYGPRDKDFVTLFDMINKNMELFIGFKKQHHTFIYVKDLVKAVFLAMESNIINKGYFVSDGNLYDHKVLGKIIRGELGKKTVRMHVPITLVRLIAMISESTKYITGKQTILNLEKINELECTNWNCDVQPLLDELNFKPEYDLNRGVIETMAWYKHVKS